METKLKRPTRFWHDSETGFIDQVYKPGFETRSIDQDHKPGLSTRFINMVSNQVDKPEVKNQVHKPGFMNLEKLKGNPLRVIRFLFGAIEDFPEKITRKIQLSEMMQALEITRDSARTGIKFLTKNGLISTVDYFAGLNGWTRYKIHDDIFNEIWSIDQVHKPGSKPGLSSSSSNLDTTTNINQVFPEIDITPLAHVGFTAAHIQQVIKMNSPQALQESIHHFAFDLEHNEKWKTHKSPLNAFMAVLRRGDPWTAENYVSPREAALQKRLDAARREKERTAKLEEELINLEFESWRKEVSEVQVSEICATKKGIPGEVALKLHFKESVWPIVKSSG